MKKKMVTTLLTALVAISLMGCSFSKTVTKTESTTNEDGTTTTTTTTTTTDNDGTTTSTEVTTDAETDANVADTDVAEDTEDNEYIVATIAFENVTGVDIYELYFSVGTNDQWGDELLGDDAPLADGEMITMPNALTYSPETGLYWDLLAADSEGGTIEFEELNMAAAADPENITIVLEYDAENEVFTATVQ